MKKFAIACAIVLAAGMMTSCGDTNYCYEVTTTYTLLGETFSDTQFIWTTSNEIDASAEQIKKNLVATGISEDIITVDYKKANKSQDDCHK